MQMQMQSSVHLGCPCNAWPRRCKGVPGMEQDGHHYFLGGAPPGGEAPSVVDLVMPVRPCIHPKP